jgi:hypothetical protein
MDTNLLRNWLGLPPGDWPPEPHLLLGSTDNVQERAVALMERLRPHQLRYPELVTEGMNRLAQALIAAEEAVKERTDRESTLSEAVALAPTPAAMPAVLDAEVVEAFPLIEAVGPAKKPRRPKMARPYRLAVPPVPAPEVAMAEPPAIPSNRRRSYQRLVRLRRARRAWDRLGPFFGVPSQELLTSGDVFRFLDVAVECRKAFADLTSWPISQGIMVRTVLWNNASLALFRDLQHSQREAVAADWAVALAQWQAEERSLRAALGASKPPRTWRQRLRAVRKWGAAHPEWKLGTLLAAATLIAVVRMAR